MHAVVIHGTHDFRYERVDVPKAGAEEVVVKVGRAGVCAADPKIFHGTTYIRPTVPIIAGHEFVGEVVELGPGAKEKFNLEIGDKAIAEQIVPCWQCYYCKRGLYHLCIVHEIFGVFGQNGGWAEYMKYPRNSIIWKVPEDMPWGTAIAIEPLSCAIHGVERAHIRLEDTVVVMGGGPIGLLMLQAAKLKNPKRLILMEILENRLSVGKALGADEVINSGERDAVARVEELTDGLGCDVILEATGHPSALELGVQMLRKQGTFMVFGVFAEKACLDFSLISDVKELKIVGGHLGTHSYPLAIKYLHEDLVKVDKIVTHNLPLRDFQRAIEISEKKLDNAIKVTMTP